MNTELPDLQDSLLDEETLEALLTDIERHASEVVITARPRPGLAPTRRATTPRECLDVLLGTPPSAVQLRYRHGGRAWCDTLVPTPDGVRLVRIAP